MHDSLPGAPDPPSQEDWLRRLADRTSAALFVKALDGRVLFVNREFERLLARPAETIVGRFDLELFPDTAATLRDNDARVIAERRAIDFEETIHTVQGSRTYLAHKFPLLGAD